MENSQSNNAHTPAANQIPATSFQPSNAPSQSHDVALTSSLQSPSVNFPPPPQGSPQPGSQQYAPYRQPSPQPQQPPYQTSSPQHQAPYSPPPQQQQQQPPYQQQQQPCQQQQQPYQQQSQYPPHQHQPQQQYGYHIPGFNVPHIPGLSHFMGTHTSQSGGYQTAPSAPPIQPNSTSPTPNTTHSATNNDPGTIHEVMGNGTTIRKHADGHKSTQHPDGTIVHNYHDGSTKTINRDGTESYYTPTTAKADYMDKAFAMGSKHLGLHLSRDTQEKITDKGRGMFEKFTGKKMPAKWSN